MRALSSRIKAMTLSFVAAITTITPAAADWMNGGHHEWGWGHAIFGSSMMILFWGGLILVIFFAARWLIGPRDYDSHAGVSRADALEILAERYARGEIDAAEYDERRAKLQS